MLGLDRCPVADQPVKNAVLDPVAAQFIVALRGIGWHQHAPHRRHAQQHQPFLGIGDIVDIGQVRQVIGQFELGRQAQEAFGIGEAVEFDAQPLAHDGIRAVCADQIIAAQLVDAGHGFDPQINAVVVLLERSASGCRSALGIGILGETIGQRAREVILFALDAEGIARDIAEFGHVEFDHFARLAITPVIDRRLEPAFEQHRRDADAIELFQRRRMEGRSAQILRAIFPGFKHDNIDACLGQQASP